jgi:signal transduction histidine kinase
MNTTGAATPPLPALEAPPVGVPAGSPVLSATDLAELIGAFNGVTARLQETHDTLRAEVARLEGELRRANEQLERSRRLAALGEMAAGIAHELRNPLGSIRLHARMLEQDLEDRPEQRQVAEKIITAVRGLDAVVTDVLTFAKELRLRSEPVDAGELLAHALDECAAWERETAARAGLPELRVVRPAAPLGIDVDGDASMLHRALVNVVRNAIEAMTPDDRERGKAGGPPPPARGARRELLVGACRRDLAEPDGSRRRMVALSVRDTGPGVSPQVMERMFNPFFTTRATGTGLGLAIVHRIVDAHGGRVSVRNHENGGAVVEILLPAAVSSSVRPLAPGAGVMEHA